MCPPTTNGVSHSLAKLDQPSNRLGRLSPALALLAVPHVVLVPGPDPGIVIPRDVRHGKSGAWLTRGEQRTAEFPFCGTSSGDDQDD